MFWADDRLLKQGHGVLLTGRNQEKLVALSQDLSQPFSVVEMSSSAPLEEALRLDADKHGIDSTHLGESCVCGSVRQPACMRSGAWESPSKVASLAAWLLDAENSWVTGQFIGIDGRLVPYRSL